ncbi:YraN family protein [Patescibacteria group bacterium]
MITEKRKIGDLGEKIATSYLENSNYEILERNYQKKWGEIDIIAKKDKIIVFVEVKTRKKSPIGDFFPPEINVNFSKQQKLVRTAQTYLLKKNLPDEITWQIDVVSIELNEKTRKADLRHIKNIII